MDAISDILRLLLAALGGGLTVKALDIAYQEYRERGAKQETAEQFVDSHLSPLLKCADELSGKLRSLAANDFRPLYDGDPSAQYRDQISTLYLISRFWAHIEIFRDAGLTINFVKDPRGRTLQKFIDCLESRPVRLADRITQRAIGELMLDHEGDHPKPLTFLSFCERTEGLGVAAQWLDQVNGILKNSRSTADRQALLVYAVVVHAMIDTLDNDHAITRDRPGLPEKLTRKTWRSLNYKVFDNYLKIDLEKAKYIGPPK